MCGDDAVRKSKYHHFHTELLIYSPGWCSAAPLSAQSSSGNRGGVLGHCVDAAIGISAKASLGRHIWNKLNQLSIYLTTEPPDLQQRSKSKPCNTQARGLDWFNSWVHKIEILRGGSCGPGYTGCTSTLFEQVCLLAATTASSHASQVLRKRVWCAQPLAQLHVPSPNALSRP